jgi:hypothetical protein
MFNITANIIQCHNILKDLALQVHKNAKNFSVVYFLKLNDWSKSLIAIKLQWCTCCHHQTQMFCVVSVILYFIFALMGASIL